MSMPTTSKKCPKCGGKLDWIIVTSKPGMKLDGNEHLVTRGFSCHGKSGGGYMSGCGYFEDHSPKKNKQL